MGILGKLFSRKKKEEFGLGKDDFRKDFDKELGLGKDFGMGDDSNAEMGPDLGMGLGSQQSHYPQQSSGYPQQSQYPSAQQGFQSQPSYQQYPQYSSQDIVNTKTLEVISSKLDSLKAYLDVINQRLANLEQIAKGEDEDSKRRRYY